MTFFNDHAGTHARLKNGGPLSDSDWDELCVHCDVEALEHAIMLGTDVNTRITTFFEAERHALDLFDIWLGVPDLEQEARQKIDLLERHGAESDRCKGARVMS